MTHEVTTEGLLVAQVGRRLPRPADGLEGHRLGAQLRRGRRDVPHAGVEAAGHYTRFSETHEVTGLRVHRLPRAVLQAGSGDAVGPAT